MNTCRPLIAGFFAACLMLATAACTSGTPGSQPVDSSGSAATSSVGAASSSAGAVTRLETLYAGPGVVFRGPENCVSLDPDADAWADPGVLRFCAVKDVFGALGGPSSGADPADFVEAKGRMEFSQPVDCDSVGALADGKHDGCAVVTGAATLLRKGVPVRLFGVCGKPVAKDCAVLGTITDPNWTPDGVYLLMDPALVDVHCQYAQDNMVLDGCNEGDAHTAGQKLPLCSVDATNPRCEYGPNDGDKMLAAYKDYCTKDPANCLENQLEAQWGPESIVAIGYLNRTDQANDCELARRKATKFTDAVNAKWGRNLPMVQISLDVSKDAIGFADAAAGCSNVR
jgi:hypothetical protein